MRKCALERIKPFLPLLPSTRQTLRPLPSKSPPVVSLPLNPTPDPFLPTAPEPRLSSDPGIRIPSSSPTVVYGLSVGPGVDLQPGILRSALWEVRPHHPFRLFGIEGLYRGVRTPSPVTDSRVLPSRLSSDLLFLVSHWVSTSQPFCHCRPPVLAVEVTCGS